MKKGFRLDKANHKNPYHGLTVFFGTKHEKDRVVRPKLETIGIDCSVADIDTDLFGTFTGEVNRIGTVRENLRKKVNAVFDEYPDCRLALASEGSFGPHPHQGLVHSDHEALLLVDRLKNREFYVDHLSTETNHFEVEFGPRDDLEAVLKRAQYPTHGLVVQAKGNSNVIFKGLRSFYEIGQAMLDCFTASPEARVVLSADLRANLNPTRMRVIEETARKLIEKLNSICPHCSEIGFWPTKAVSGLPCNSCDLPTERLKGHSWGCEICAYEEYRGAESRDGVDPKFCSFCNP